MTLEDGVNTIGIVTEIAYLYILPRISDLPPGLSKPENTGRELYPKMPPIGMISSGCYDENMM